MKTQYYKQCKLSKSSENGDLIETAWIPEKFAKKNKYLKLKHKGEQINGWKIISVGTRLPNNAIIDWEYKEYRIEIDT